MSNKGGGGGIKAKGVNQPWFNNNVAKRRKARKVEARARKKNR